MVSVTDNRESELFDAAAKRQSSSATIGSTLLTFLIAFIKALASLRLTVVLLAMAIFLVFTGTLAQTDRGIWYLVSHHFRCWMTWIDLSVFCQPIFFTGNIHIPSSGLYGFPFPGGKMIGTLMFVNLLAAHGLRFRVQARGSRLVASLVTVAAGCGMTALVIGSGSQMAVPGEARFVEWAHFSMFIKGVLGALWFAAVYALVTVDRARKIERAATWFVLAAATGILGWIFYEGKDLVLSQASLRILLQLTQGGVAGLVLLAGCWLLFYRRAGIVLLHAGIGLLMANEIIVAESHVEARMNIREGQTVNFASDMRSAELAIIDTSDPAHDRHIVIPEAMLLEGAIIRGADLPSGAELPWDIRIVDYMPNSDIDDRRPSDPELADTGVGRRWSATEVQEGVGTDQKATFDIDSAYLEILDRDSQEVIGKYLVTAGFLGVQPVEHAGEKRLLALRFERHYKPYSIRLDDFRFDKYIGTNKAKSYSSDLQLMDSARGIDRPIRIWMNNPLRYGGETFYQSGFDGDEKGTVLQVVTNTGWMVPYVSCMLVAIGMFGQFGATLSSFLRRKPSREPRRESPAVGALARYFPWVVLAIFVVYLASKAMPTRAKVEEPTIADFGQLPVAYQGRVKPYDTFARNSLLFLSNKDALVDQDGNKLPAMRWLLDVASGRDEANDYRVFRIDNLEVLDALGLKPRKRYRYSVRELGAALPELEKQFAQAIETPEAERSLYENRVLRLKRKLDFYLMLVQSHRMPPIRPEHVMDDLLQSIAAQRRLEQSGAPLSVPPQVDGGQWEMLSESTFNAMILRIAADEELREKFFQNRMLLGALRENPRLDEQLELGLGPNPAVKPLNTMLAAYLDGDADAFNTELNAYRAALEADPPAEWNKARIDFEAYFNHVAPFRFAAVLYCVAFVLAVLGWLGWSGPFNRASYLLLVFALVVHTLAIVGRIYISGRPPVTNLYSSAVFIGWGCVVLSLILERVYRLGIGNVVAAVAGFSTLLVASALATDDTFKVVVAVLDTQFWLTTHVVCITLGYAATFLAGLFGLVYVLKGTLTPSLTADVKKDLSRMIYGTLCFATFLSFVGTVLGGLWADDSWGRFWGWDPKENGALIIVLWNALVLHARWGGIVQQRGVAVLAIVGNIVTAWSWFGVNELGVGLHSYGFTEGTRNWLSAFVVSQLVVIALGMLPTDYWSSSGRSAARA